MSVNLSNSCGSKLPPVHAMDRNPWFTTSLNIVLFSFCKSYLPLGSLRSMAVLVGREEIGAGAT